jgi:glutamate synthase (NADPH/NADH) large chain
MAYLPENEGLYNRRNEHDNCGIGYVAHVKGEKSHSIVEKGLEVLSNLRHRGAEGADSNTGDGAGITLQIPRELYVKEGISLPENGKFGTGLLFLPQIEEEAKYCTDKLTELAENTGLELIQIREVPTNSNAIGDLARAEQPIIRQVFLKADLSQEVLERKLFILRRKLEKTIETSRLRDKERFYVVSLSSRVVIYKGLFTSLQLKEFYKDLNDKETKSAIALVHSRYSTNTFPTWDLAQPFRMLCHNGEINSVQGNKYWMHARSSLLKSDMLGDEINDVLPVIQPEKSDSAALDNTLEFLVQSGKSLPHAMAMLIPESWNTRNPIPDNVKAFYEYHSTFMEPWDGPAAVLFTDGRYIGGLLDRNGLRPSRYILTENDIMIMSSEVGVLEIPDHKIREKGRLRPGKILLLDTGKGKIYYDPEVKQQLASQKPYAQWLRDKEITLDEIPLAKKVPVDVGENHDKNLLTFGYTLDEVKNIIRPMACEGKEPVGSMGNDTPLAVASKIPQRLFNYFRQHFAQVTNPAIDPIREEVIMTLTGYIGSHQKNLLNDIPDHARMIKFLNPVITNKYLEILKNLKYKGFYTTTIPILFDANSGSEGLKKGLDEICRQAEKAVDAGMDYIILSDRGINKDKAPIPSLLAVSAVHHHLIRKQKRIQIDIVIETGEPREVMHFALLFGYGASIINPYMAFAVIDQLVKQQKLQIDYHTAEANYTKAIRKGIFKVMSKMGTSTLRSYRGAQLFEAIGLNKEFIDQYFTGTASAIEGLGLDEIARENLIPHSKAFNNQRINFNKEFRGTSYYRYDAEDHAWNPETIGYLQHAVKNNDPELYKKFSEASDRFTQEPSFLRGFLDFKKNPIDISKVESAESIMKRFTTGAMSFGSLSKEAHETLAIAMNHIGGKSNTGEGGEDPGRFQVSPNGENKRSAIKQIASGRFGVTTHYLVNADEIQIKIAQGSKPGEGGQLPGTKVDSIIAKTRNSTPGITLISPPPHHDIYSIEDLAQLIFDLKNVNPEARINVKLVSEFGVGTVAAGVAKGGADSIAVSGSEGGTGASPLSSILHAGLPMEIGLSETQQTLVKNNLRDRVTLYTDGQLKTGRDVITAALLGAEEYGFATGALVTVGCILLRKCNLNTCSVGVCTQDPKLRERFSGKPVHVIRYFKFLAEEIREYLANLGFTKMEDIIGRSDLLVQRKKIQHWKLKNVSLKDIIQFPAEAKEYEIHKTVSQKPLPGDLLDHKIIREAQPALQSERPVEINHKIKNTDRATGAMLSYQVDKLYGEKGLPEDTIKCNFKGSAGQSFGAFLKTGINFRLEGQSNDYLGKGLSGGKIIVKAADDAAFEPEKNIIIGNTTLYGATGGEVYINGLCGERFCVRNSGATAVVEGTGDHCCEYMTGGVAVVLGEVGRNMAAGMSGGVAYVYNPYGDLDYFCNMEMVNLEIIEDFEDLITLKQLIQNHYRFTASNRAKKILDNWEKNLKNFIKVIPFEYKRYLEEKKLQELNQKISKYLPEQE